MLGAGGEAIAFFLSSYAKKVLLSYKMYSKKCLGQGATPLHFCLKLFFHFAE